jgi:D-amino-acid oxidase
VTQLDALVIGAGVVGLTTAISLAEAGLKTRIRTAVPPEASTSAAAGAVWGPVLCGPKHRTLEWARTGLSVMSGLAAGEPASGIRMVSGREVSRTPAEPPAWTSLLPDGTGPAELPEGFVAGWRYTAPLATMPVYLAYLAERFRQAGGVIEPGSVTSLRDLTDAPLLVNCTGVGARDLAGDPEMVPVRGQVVIVTNPGVDEFYIDHGEESPDYVYFFPHGSTVLLGGTAHHGAWDLTPRPGVAERIQGDCARACPALAGASVVEHRVGLRPYRPEVRLEAEKLPEGRVLWHNYGHGGGGVTLSWGCAREITEAVLSSRPADQPAHPA